MRNADDQQKVTGHCYEEERQRQCGGRLYHGPHDSSVRKDAFTLGKLVITLEPLWDPSRGRGFAGISERIGKLSKFVLGTC
jgi:hypothetical protein